MDGGFGAQDAALGGIGLIVALDGVAVDAVIELASDAVEQLGPFRFELTIHQALSLGPVGNVREAVIMLQVLQAGGLHLSRQPFPSVEADLNGEREPSLNAGIEKAEDRMDLVVVEEQAFARA